MGDRGKIVYDSSKCFIRNLFFSRQDRLLIYGAVRLPQWISWMFATIAVFEWLLLKYIRIITNKLMWATFFHRQPNYSITLESLHFGLVTMKSCTMRSKSFYRKWTIWSLQLPEKGFFIINRNSLAHVILIPTIQREIDNNNARNLFFFFLNFQMASSCCTYIAIFIQISLIRKK